MSLINDALKKAQKQRTGEAPSLGSMPSIGGEAPQRIAKRAKPAGFNALVLRLSLGAAGVAVLVIGAVALLNRKPASPKPVTTVAAPTTPTEAPAKSPAAPTTTPVAPATTPASTAFVLPIATPETTPATTTATSPIPAAATAASHESKPVPVATNSAPPPVSVVPPPAAKPAGPAPKLPGKAIDYIEALRVAGIRASATDSKVLMNDRVYRLGDIVEHEMNLKLVGITSSSLTFENEEGARYTRTF